MSENINVVIVSGNLTRSPEVRRTQSGMAIMSFGIAVNDRKKNNQTGEWEDVAGFYDVTMFGARAESLSKYIDKGTHVVVSGKLRWSQWQDKQTGNKRSKVEIIAEDVELPPRQQGHQQTSQPLNQGGSYQASTSTSGPEIDPYGMYADDSIPF